jgi:hypothetical protein
MSSSAVRLWWLIPRSFPPIGDHHLVGVGGEKEDVDGFDGGGGHASGGDFLFQESDSRSFERRLGVKFLVI